MTQARDNMAQAIYGLLVDAVPVTTGAFAGALGETGRERADRRLRAVVAEHDALVETPHGYAAMGDTPEQRRACARRAFARLGLPDPEVLLGNVIKRGSIEPGETITDTKISGRDGWTSCFECTYGMALDGSVRVTLSRESRPDRDVYVHRDCMPLLRERCRTTGFAAIGEMRRPDLVAGSDKRTDVIPAALRHEGLPTREVLQTRALGLLDLPDAGPTHRYAFAWSASVMPMGLQIVTVFRVNAGDDVRWREGHVAFTREGGVMVAFEDPDAPAEEPTPSPES